MEHVDILIIGAGPAGLTAAIYARRAGKSVLLLEKSAIGGQIASSPQVQNFPGLPSISGAELADRLFDQATALGARLELEEVLEIRDGDPKTVVTDYASYTCSALIFAAGMTHRSLGLPREDTLPGISFCAVCDGAFYAGKDTAVCGGGNTALQDALYLSGLCRQVTLIHRRGTFRGDPILVDTLRQRPNVSFALDTVIEELLGTDALTGLRLRSPGKTWDLPVSGLFQAVGQLPQTALISPLLPLDGAGFLSAGEDCRTSRPGIFAAGDCRAKSLRQLTTACADGSSAATAAVRYLEALSPDTPSVPVL
ncbi:MAG: FAD-dependent oxidoreductase [Oscillibacter sp.]|nr:FAD-dependent oxidoreductase [Oscillibacter sp.]